MSESLTNQEIKELHEESVTKGFLEHYNLINNTNIKFLKHGVQGNVNEPDSICSEDINIEIVTVYYSNEHAQYEWEMARSNLVPSESFGVINNPDELAFNFLEEQLRIKEDKLKNNSYNYSGKLFLIVDCSITRITNNKDYREYFKNSDHIKSLFDGIWLRTFINYSPEYDYIKIK